MPSLTPSCCLESPQRLLLTAIYLPIFTAKSRSNAGDDLTAPTGASVKSCLFSGRNEADIIILLGRSTADSRRSTLIELFWPLCVMSAANCGSPVACPHLREQCPYCNTINNYPMYGTR